MLSSEMLATGEGEMDLVLKPHLDELLKKTTHDMSYAYAWGKVVYTAKGPVKEIYEIHEDVDFFTTESARARTQTAIYNRIHTIMRTLRQKGVPVQEHSIDIVAKNQEYNYGCTLKVTSRSVANCVRECLGRLIDPHADNLLPIAAEASQDDIRALGLNALLLQGFYRNTLSVNDTLENIRQIS